MSIALDIYYTAHSAGSPHPPPICGFATGYAGSLRSSPKPLPLARLHTWQARRENVRLFLPHSTPSPAGFHLLPFTCKPTRLVRAAGSFAQKNIRTLYVAAVPFARSKDRLTPCPSVNPPGPSVNPPVCSHASCILLPCFLKHTNAASTAPNKPHRPFVTRACHVPCAAACPYTTHTWTRVDRTRARIDQRNKTHHNKSLHVRYSPTLSENSRHHARSAHWPCSRRSRSHRRAT